MGGQLTRERSCLVVKHDIVDFHPSSSCKLRDHTSKLDYVGSKEICIFECANKLSANGQRSTPTKLPQHCVLLGKAYDCICTIISLFIHILDPRLRSPMRVTCRIQINSYTLAVVTHRPRPVTSSSLCSCARVRACEKRFRSDIIKVTICINPRHARKLFQLWH